ncbi:MAG: hypothetical protein WDA71_14230, partial [Actinomycetota bacterium]
VMFASDDPIVVASAWNAVDAKRPRATVCMRSPFGEPISDSAGYYQQTKGRTDYWRAGGVPYISWISGPPYLLNDGDTLDKIDRANLVPVAETVAEIVRNCLAMPRP